MSISSPITPILSPAAAPYFIRQLKDITASEEEDAEFECDASGVPKPNVVWSINGKAIGGET